MRLKHLIHKSIVCVATICCSLIANAYTPSYYASDSKLKSGHWVKVKVSEIGMQEISYDQLRELGFSDPSKVCVYGYGGTLLTKNTFDTSLPDDLPAVPVYYGDDKIIFYGEPDLRVNLGNGETKIEVLRNMYSSAGYYFLSDYNQGASQIPSSKNYNLSNILSREYHNSIIYIENEVENPGQAGTYFFDKSLLNGPQSYSFDIKKPFICDVSAVFKYNYAAKVPVYTALQVDFNYPDSLITKTKNNQVIPSSLESQYFYTSDGEIQFLMTDSSPSNLTFNISFPSDKKATYAAIDNAYVIYRRQNDFEGESQLRMSFTQANQNTNFIITNGNENIQVWNVTNPLNIFPHSLKYNEGSKNLIGTFDKSYNYSTTGNPCLVAFDPNKEMHKVEIVGKVENQSLHNLSTPNMVIITNDLCQPYAEQVAQAHRDYQKLDVLVVNQKEIFNEFSSGTPSAMGYRRFLKMFYDRNKTKLKYLLLFGEGSWDNRGVIYPKEDRLLTYQAEVVEDARSAAKAFCGDSYFGMLNDNYEPNYFYNTEVLLGIGRIPVQTHTNAQAITNKIINYLKNPPTVALFNRALILADEGDGYGHIMQQEENIDSILSISPTTTCTKAFSTFYPSSDKDAPEARDLITQALNRGQIFFSFAGHGAEVSFTPKNLWTANNIKETSYNHPPFAMFATCDAFSFDRREGGMAEQGLYKEDGGFIAIVAASRTVYMQFNQYINRAFTCELFKASNNDLIGDVFRKARNRASTEISDRTLGVNTMCYNLAGDPALPLYKPTLNVATTTINEIEVENNATSYPVINPLSKNILKGNIVDNNGNVQKTFNGSITLTIYDGPSLNLAYAKKSGNNTSYIVEFSDSILTEPGKSYCKSDSVAIIFDENQLSEISVPVTNGEFEVSLVTPLPQKANSINRITYFAISNDKQTRASGHFNYVKVGGYNEETVIDDTTAPIIDQCYINDPSFANGDIVGSDFTFYAFISADESGLNTALNSLGAAATLTLDGKKTFPFASSAITNNTDGSASLEYFINDIEDGMHTLTLSIKDNIGNCATKTISFVVINSSAQVSLNVAETPARSEATFDIDHNFLNEPMGRIIIEDCNGDAIFTKNNCTFPFTWDLKDANGNAVSDGNYKAYVILKGGNLYGSSNKIDVIVVK